MRTPAEIYEAFETGDVLTDDELDAGITHFQALGKLALMAGPPFRLVGLAANHVADGLGRYRLARQQDWWR